MVELIKMQNGYKIFFDGIKAGLIEYKDFWKSMPYLSLIKLLPGFRRKGIGKEAMRLFESEMKRAGNKAILLSTRVFYRKIGYRECGSLILEDTPLSQPMEMFFIKTL